MERVAFIIPTVNEAGSIGQVIDRIPIDDLRKDGYETSVYVVDGLSVDNTRDIAAEKGAQLIIEQRKGKGVALQTAFKSIDADYVIMCDGDNTYPLEVATEMVRLLQTSDVVVGSRLKGTIEAGAMSRMNVIGNTLLTLFAQLLFDARITDLCSGLWAYRSDAVSSLKLSAQGFDIEADMFAQCVINRCRIAEIPITYHPREDQPKLSSVKDGLKIGLFLCKQRLQTRRMAGKSKPEPEWPMHEAHSDTNVSRGFKQS